MAKLSARGRTEIFRMEKEDNAPKSDLITYERSTIALMSDGNILQKRDVIFPAGPYDNGKDKRHTYNWTVKGKIKLGVHPDQLMAVYIKRGYTVK